MNKLSKNEIISLLLLALGCGLTIFTMLSTGIRIINYEYSKNNIENYNIRRLNRGDIVHGEFKSQENYLGSISVRFSTFTHVNYENEDTLLFRIKEKGVKEWYYQNYYRSGLLYTVPFLPFGFPVIDHSKSKIYDFELISLNGNKNNSVSLSSKEPLLLSTHQYPKQKILSNNKELVSYFFKKGYAFLSIPDNIFFLFIYFSPLIVFVFFYKKIDLLFIQIRNKYPRFISIFRIDRAILVAILIDSFLIPENNEIILFVVIPLLFFSSRMHSLSSSYFFKVGILLLVLASILGFAVYIMSAKKIASWAFLYLVVGIIEFGLKTYSKGPKV